MSKRAITNRKKKYLQTFTRECICGNRSAGLHGTCETVLETNMETLMHSATKN